ncbi:hypothetical protein NA57DRAFT_67381 [Rhizodiscina lignyota]|uniref:Endonuclease/exonuclease/phosphatase domain-containing protein n=1 Tax=Rhizodiscina lignyota TaxID=1504668 RepID=A0A9P4ICD0_9PEZI|nr:hypothetical protein NA57DRAFT_67381 [Rhizodiscina lignyota]
MHRNIISDSTASSTPNLQLRIVTHNIRYATSDPFPNERLWIERAPRVLNQLRHEVRYLSGPPSSSAIPTTSTNAFICLQEVLHSQLNDILAGLNYVRADGDALSEQANTIWSYVGVGRDDGKERGEYSPILYPIQTFRLLHNETVWLSPTPDRPSKGWDAGSIRILTLAVFEHRRTRQRVLAANTHLDNAAAKSRKESVRIILETLRRIHEWLSPRGKLPIFLTGDFNSLPTDEAYLEMKRSGCMIDLHSAIPSQYRYGENATFTGFEPGKYKGEQGRIDFIWLGPQTTSDGLEAKEGKKTQMIKPKTGSPWQVDGYAVLPSVFDDGIYLSDHRVVVGDVRTDL